MRCSVTSGKIGQCPNEVRGTSKICQTHKGRIARHGDVQADRPIRPYTKPTEYVERAALKGVTDEEKFYNRIKATNEHWLWTGSTMKSGSPQAQHAGTNKSGARVAWELDGREVPEGAIVRPFCGEKLCVYVEHLELILTGRKPLWEPEIERQVAA
ncbi:HNH endonuclease [Streptomyces phage phiScoe56]|nr:HNH endonuclease [Streptomyces phage phiScoe56]